MSQRRVTYITVNKTFRTPTHPNETEGLSKHKQTDKMYWNISKTYRRIMFKLMGGEKWLTKKRLFQVFSFCPKAKLKSWFFFFVCFYNNTFSHSRVPGQTRQTGALYLPVCSFWHSADLAALISQKSIYAPRFLVAFRLLHVAVAGPLD